MITLSFAFSLLALAVPQTQHIVNGINPSPGEFATIYDAVQASSAGDEVLVKGIMHNGSAIGYSEYRYLTGAARENFPIPIGHSLTIRPFNPAVPVLVWSSSQLPPEALFKITNSLPSSSTVIIEELTLIGSDCGIKVHGRTNSSSSILIKKCNFDQNKIGIAVEADSGATPGIAIRNCKIIDMNLIIDPLLQYPEDPNYQGQTTGIKLFAEQSSSTANPGQIGCEIFNLKTVGPFDSMAPGPLDETRADPDFPIGGTSRLIEVHTIGRSREFGGLPIAQVELEIDSCVLNGHANDSPPIGTAGWDLGLYASAQFPDDLGALDDYTSAFEVTVTGSTFTDFRTQAIHGESDADTRGSIWLNGGTVVSRTSRDRDPSILTNGQGIRIHSFEGYMGLHSEGAEVYDNRDDGISLFAEGSNQSVTNIWPSGIFLDLNNSRIYKNGGHGLRGRAKLGAIGGTWKYQNSGVLFTDSGLSAPVEHGQGSINSCTFSNNGECGISIHARGTHVLPTNSLGLASLRIINSFIWNHPLEGIQLEMDNKPFCFVPIVHSTVVGNGDSALDPSNIELNDYSNGLPSMYRVEVFGSVQRVLTTKFYNTIFQRKNYLSVDIGPTLNDVLVDEIPANTGNTNPFKIGVAGSRGRYNSPPEDFGFIESTGDAAPFGTINWGSDDPSQFFYDDGVPVPTAFDRVPLYLHIDETESNFDFEGEIRPTGINHHERDKGGDQEDDS